MKKTLLFGLVLSQLIVKSQNIADFIPSNAQFVFSLNYSQLDQKSGEMDYRKYLESFNSRPSYQYYSSEENVSCEIVSIFDLMKHPDSFGVNTKENIFFYKTSVKNISGTVYLFRLNKTETFENKLNLNCSDPLQLQKRNLANGSLYMGKKISVAINGNIAAVFVKDYNYSFDGMDYSFDNNSFADSAYVAEKNQNNFLIDSTFYEKLNQGTQNEIDYDLITEQVLMQTDTSIRYRAKEREKAKKLEQMNQKFKEIQSLMESFVQVQPDNINKNRNFSKLVSESHDAFIYLNTLSAFSNHSMNPLSSARYMYGMDYIEETPQTQNFRLTNNISSSYTIDFENGKAVMQLMNTYNEHVYPYFKRAYGVKQNKNLLKYIDGSNLLGYMSIAVNTVELAKFYEDFYKELLQNMPKSKYQMNILPSMQLAYAFIDKEMLYNTLDGRVIFACTGFTDLKIKYTSYDFDEDFNKNEKTEERVIRQPRMVMAASIGNKENAKKLFDIVSQFNIFTKLKDNVFAFYGDNNTPMNLYFTLTDDALIVSNDMASGMNQGQIGKIPPADLKQIMGHNMAIKIHAEKMMAEIQNTYLKGSSSLPWFTNMMTSLGNIEMYDSKPSKDTYGATAVIYLQNSSTNALYQLLKMMQATNGY